MIILMKSLNEEKVVKRCLDDFHDLEWVDRVIVIDGKSTDYTVQELERYTKTEVYIHPWNDWYHDMEVCQSNIALSYVPNGELAFILDFDERISPQLKEELAQFDTEGVQCDVTGVARKTIEVLRHEDSPHAIIDTDGWPIESHQIGQFPDYQCRLIRRHPDLHWVNSPHHVMRGQKSEGDIKNTLAYILHYEKDDYRDRERIEKKWLRCQARRKMLNLPHDVFETKIKPEIGEYADPTFWDWRV